MVQNFPGAPNGARKGLKPLIWGLFRREAAKFFWGIFAKNPEMGPGGGGWGQCFFKKTFSIT